MRDSPSPHLAPALTVQIRWGESLLAAAHLAPPRAYHVGEAGDPPCDCLIPASLLGARRAPLTIVEDGGVRLVVPRGASGTLSVPGRAEASLRALADAALPFPELRGARAVPLPLGARATMTLGEVVFEIEHDIDAPAVTPHLRRRPGGALGMATSAALHAALLVVAAAIVPALGDTAPARSDQDQKIDVHVLLAVAAEPGEVNAPPPPMEGDGADHDRTQTKCAEERGGTMGEATAAAHQTRYGVQGTPDNPDPHISRSEGDDFWWALWWGNRPIGVFTSAPPRTPVVPWGRDDAFGNDPASARAGLWGDTVAPAFGSPGFGVGRAELCPTCGAIGRGLAPDGALGEGGGAVPTESTRMAAR